MNRLLVKLSSRRCKGCSDPSPHSHHLTWIGRLRYATPSLREKPEPDPEYHIYGLDNTIHTNESLDVEVGPNGQVVSIWFRCAMIPFRVFEVDKQREQEMLPTHGHERPLIGVVFGEES